jgi:hypothetical protein
MATSIIRANGESLTFDATAEVRFAPSIRITEHPIEDGSLVADHAQANPTPVLITGLVSNAPLDNGANLTATRQIDAVRFFESIIGELVTVTSDRIGTVGSLMLAAYPHSFRQAPLFFDVELRPVVLAEAGVVFIPVSAPAAAQQVGFPDATDSGEQPTTTTNASEAEADTSFLFDLFGG